MGEGEPPAAAIRRRAAGVLAATLLLGGLAAQTLWSARIHAATFDEPTRLGVGAFMMSGAPRVPYPWRGNPPLACWLGSLFVPWLRVPGGFWNTYGADDYVNGLNLLYASGLDPQDVLWWSRLPMLLVALGTAWLVQGWASSLGGRPAGLAALALYVLSPSTVAFASMLNSDLLLASTTLLAMRLVVRHLESPSRGRAAGAGAALGLVLLAKGTGIIVILLAAGLVCAGRGGRPWRRFAAEGLVAFGVAVLIWWAGHGFEVGPATLSAERPHVSIDRRLAGNPALQALAYRIAEGVPLPCPSYWKMLHYIADKNLQGPPTYLLGRFSGSGFPSYYAVALAVKTPIPLLILAVAGFAGAWSLRRSHPASCRALAGVLVAFFALGTIARMQAGYRYILPVEPAGAVLAGAGLVVLGRRLRGRAFPVVVGCLTAWAVFADVRYAPHQAEYFNEWAGGPEGGARILLDSNLDWGQDLLDLKRLQAAHGLRPLYLHYFGTEQPERRGIACEPGLPRPGVKGYAAVSATYLYGLYLEDPDSYAWLRKRTPWGRAGYSIWIYELE